MENGYDKESDIQPMDTSRANLAKVLLNPLFWQALGKGLGWGEWTIPYDKFEHKWELTHYLPDTGKTPVYRCRCGARKINNVIEWDGGYDYEEKWMKWPQKEWHMTVHDSWKRNSYKKYMHRFIDHLIEGKSIESFFESLTK